MNLVGIARGLVLSAAWVALQSGARAQVSAQSAAPSDFIAFRAPGSCPGAESWTRQVLERLALAARERGRRQLLALVAGVEVSPDGKRASLLLNGVDEPRIVVGEDCSEVLAGAALIAALALGSELQPEPANAVSVTEPSAGPEPANAVSVVPLAEPEPANAISVVPLESQGLARDPGALDRRWPAPAWPAEPKQPRPARSRAAIGAGIGAHTGIAPGPAAVFDAALELAWPERGWSLRGRGSFASSRALVQERGARFEYVGGGIDLCPIVLGAHLDWQWRSCIALDLGRVHAAGDAGSALRTAAEHWLWWSALGLETRLQLPRVYGVRFELEGGASTPLWHRRFEFDAPDAAVFETPRLAVSARLGLQVPLE